MAQVLLFQHVFGSKLGDGQAELSTFPGDRHLFADCSLPGHDPDAAALLLRRTLGFLESR